MDKLISVIVPIYKVEKYLGECIESLINQTYKNLEIILVDDGSPDNCGKICEEYKEKDERIVVIHKENGGLSDARNAGMKVMTGDYLVFVDSDDYMPSDGIETLVKLLEERNADMVIGGVWRVSEQGEKLGKEVMQNCDITEMDTEEALKDFFVQGCSSWGRIYKREIHEGIEFPKGEINEDEAIVVQVTERCKKVVRTSTPIYCYRLRGESITTTDFHEKKLVWNKHCMDNYEYIKRKYPEIEPYARKRYTESLVWLTLMMIQSSDNYEAEIKDYANRLKKHIWFYLFSRDIKLQSKIYGTLICMNPELLKNRVIRLVKKVLRRG